MHLFTLISDKLEKNMKQFLMDGRNSRADGEVIKDAVFWTAEVLRKLSTYL